MSGRIKDDPKKPEITCYPVNKSTLDKLDEMMAKVGIKSRGAFVEYLLIKEHERQEKEQEERKAKDKSTERELGGEAVNS